MEADEQRTDRNARPRASECLTQGCFGSWYLISLLLLARLAADLARLGSSVSRWELVWLGLGAVLLAGFLDDQQRVWSFPFSLRIAALLVLVCGLGFLLTRWELALLGLGVGMLSGFFAPRGDPLDFYHSLRCCVLLFIVCGLVAAFMALMVLGFHWPAWLAIPIALLLSFFAMVLLASGVGGLPFELVEPFCIILLLAQILFPVFKQAKQKAELNRKQRQVPGPVSPTHSQPQSSIRLLPHLVLETAATSASAELGGRGGLMNRSEPKAHYAWTKGEMVPMEAAREKWGCEGQGAALPA